MSIIRKYWFLIILLLFALFLRFYKLSDWFFFNIDEDCYHFIVKKIIFDKRPVLVGCWEIPGGLPIPPMIYYFGALLMFLFKNNPLGMSINASFWGIIGVYFIYKVGKEFFHSQAIVIYSSIIYTFSYLVNIYNRLTLTIWLGPILSLFTYLSLLKLIQRGEKKWLFFLSFVFVLATQEGSLFSLIVLSILCFIIFRKKIKIKILSFLFFALFLSFTPLIIFDLRHNFILSQKILNFFSLNKNNSFNLFLIEPYFKLLFSSITRLLIPTGPNDLNIQILPCKEYLKTINSQTPFIYSLIGLFLILFFVFYSLKKNLLGAKLVLLHLLVILLGLVFYSFINPGHLYEWFFVVLFPAFCFMSGCFLDFLKNLKVGRIIIACFFFLFLSINLKFILTGTSVVGYQDKLNAVKYAVEVVGNEEFSLEMLGNGCNGYGYRYLFTYLNKEPAKSYMDYQYAGWLYPETQNKEPSNKIILVPLIDLDTEDLKKNYQRLKTKSTQSKKFNNLEVLLVKS